MLWILFIYLYPDGWKCDCTGTGYGGTTCSIYFPYGPQTNVNEERVTSGGWTECHSESMTVHQSPSSLDAIMRRCSKSNLIMGCRKVGSPTITLLAAAPDGKEALKVTGASGQIINGSKWYRATGSSYGFAHERSSVRLSSADPGTEKAEMRLSYHISGSGGYRCGSTKSLNNNNGWERLYYHAD